MTKEEKKRQDELWKQDRIRERHEEWMKIRQMGPGARLQYFWDYYKIVLVIAAILVFAVYLTVVIINGVRTKTLLYVCFLNTEALDPDTETLKDDYIKARGGIDKMEEIVFDSSVWVNPDADGTSRADVAASIKITSYVGAGTLDVFLAPSYVTKYEQESGMLMELENILTKDEIRTLSENGCLYYDSVPETERLSDTEANQASSTGQNTETGQVSGMGQNAETEQVAETGQASGGNQIPETGQASGTGQNSETGQSAETGQASEAGQAEEDLNTQPGNGMHIYAVRIDPYGVIGNYDIYGDDRQVWFSIIGNSGRTEESVQLLHFLLNELPEETEGA